MGEGRGGNIAGHNGLDERGEGESCMQIFFHTGWSGETSGGRRRVKQAFRFQGALNYCM